MGPPENLLTAPQITTSRAQHPHSYMRQPRRSFISALACCGSPPQLLLQAVQSSSQMQQPWRHEPPAPELEDTGSRETGAQYLLHLTLDRQTTSCDRLARGLRGCVGLLHA